MGRSLVPPAGLMPCATGIFGCVAYGGDDDDLTRLVLVDKHVPNLLHRLQYPWRRACPGTSRVATAALALRTGGILGSQGGGGTSPVLFDISCQSTRCERQQEATSASAALVKDGLAHPHKNPDGNDEAARTEGTGPQQRRSQSKYQSRPP